MFKQFAPLIPATDAAAVDAWIRMEEELTHVTLPVLEDLIRRVASMWGRTIRKETDATLMHQFELPKSTDRFLSQIISSATKAQPTAAPSGETGKPGAGD
jgi:hypothetical protein